MKLFIALSCLLLGVGVLIGSVYTQSQYETDNKALIGFNDDLNWKVWDLEERIKVCEWNSGVSEELVLSPYVRG